MRVFDPAKHPRHPAGSAVGGRFRPGDRVSPKYAKTSTPREGTVVDTVDAGSKRERHIVKWDDGDRGSFMPVELKAAPELIVTPTIPMNPRVSQRKRLWVKNEKGQIRPKVGLSPKDSRLTHRPAREAQIEATRLAKLRGQQLGIHAAVFDPAKHPRHPGGTDRGGEWAPKAMPLNPEGEWADPQKLPGTWSADAEHSLVFDGFDPNNTVGFDQREGGRKLLVGPGALTTSHPGVWWKASYYHPEGRLVMWVPNEYGGPHHYQVSEAMGWETNGQIRDWDRRVDIMGAGYGENATIDVAIDPFDPDDKPILEMLRARIQEPNIDRQLRRAQQLAEDNQDARLAASAAEMTADEFNRQMQAATKIAEMALLPKLIDAYRLALVSVAADVARRFAVKATRLTAAAWDESKHPRDPGGEGGGQWVEAQFEQAAHDKIGNLVYLDRDGDYRYRKNGKPGGPVTPWNDAIKEMFGNDQIAFHNAANEFLRPVTLAGAIGDEHAQPQFAAPEVDELIPKDKLAKEIERRTRRIRELAVGVQVANTLAAVGISFDIGGIFAERILDKVGARVRDADLSTRDAVRTIINDAQAEGWTVPETAAEIKAHITGLSQSTATQLARTDLVGTANASAIVAARMVFEGQRVNKIWLATPDERTRETHLEADGQTVPLDQPFEVGDDRLDYPGDPDGSDEEVCNCRCTVLFEPVAVAASAGEVWEALTAALVPSESLLRLTTEAQSAWQQLLPKEDGFTAAFDPSLHPRRPAGDTAGGEWAPKFTTSIYTYKRSDPDDWMKEEYDEISTWPPTANRDAALQAVKDRRAGADVILARDRGGRIVGAASLFPWNENDTYDNVASVGYAGAIDNSGLALFEATVEHAAHIGEGVWWQATVTSEPLYEKLGIPQAGPMEYLLTPEQAQLLAEDGFALARRKRQRLAEPMAASVWDGVLVAAFDESKYARNPSGERDGVESPSDGGKFRSKEGAGGAGEARQGTGWDDPMWDDVREKYESWGYGPGGEISFLQGESDEPPEDPALKEMVRVAGYDAFPKQMTAAEMTSLPEGWTVVYRGIDNVEQARAFREGDYWAGRGAFGNGTYFTDKFREAESYAGWDGVVIEVAIPPDALISDYATLDTIISDRRKAILDAALPDELRPDRKIVERGSWKQDVLNSGSHGTRLASDHGRTAVSRGLDGYKQGGGFGQGGGTFYVIQNRGAVFMSERYYDQTSGTYRNFSDDKEVSK